MKSTMKISKRILLCTLGAAVLIAAAACSNPDAADGTQGTAVLSTETAIPVSSQTPIQTSDPPTDTPPLVAFLAGPDADQETALEVGKMAANVAGMYNLNYQQYQQLSAQDLPAKLLMVVAVPPAEGLQELVAASPGTQFVAVNIPGLSPAENLTRVNLSESDPGFEGFVAGYAAVIMTEEWRVGGLAKDNPRGRLIEKSFVNGVVHYCGLCLPEFPPYEYPKFYTVSPEAALGEKLAEVDRLIADGTRTIYIGPGVGEEGLYRYLVERSMQIVGSEAPPEFAAANWILSVEQSKLPDLESLLQQVLQQGGQGNTGINSLELTYINYEIISQARIDFILQILGELQNGHIDPIGN